MHLPKTKALPPFDLEHENFFGLEQSWKEEVIEEISYRSFLALIWARKQSISVAFTALIGFLGLLAIANSSANLASIRAKALNYAFPTLGTLLVGYGLHEFINNHLRGTDD